MLSRKTKYALKALIALAEHGPETPVRIADLARDQQIPPKFLELILLELRNQGILRSRKGKGGGYLLAVDTLGRTMAAIEVPPGVLTAFVGVPVFVWLLAVSRRGWQ